MGDLVFFGTLISGSIYAAVKHERKFEETLPITCMSIVLILFLFGLANKLKYGVVAVLIIACCLLLLSVKYLLQGNSVERKVVWMKLLTPAFSLFLGYLLIFYVCGYGLVAYEWDSFSHWMDSAKAMVQIDDFVTNPASNSMFQSYPPGMALFQYFMQKVCLFFSPEMQFIEWRAYLAYSVLSMSVMLPFLSKLSFKKPMEMIVKGSIVFLMPIRFFPEMYATVMIDPFVGILAGSGFAALMLCERKDPLHLLHITLICVTLVLTKDVGLFFASFISVGFILLSIEKKEHGCLGLEGLKTAGMSIFPLTGMLVTRKLWKGEILRSGARVIFGEKVPILKYTEIFFLNNDTTYFQDSVNAFKTRFFEPIIPVFLGGKLFTISYFIFTLVVILLAVFLCVLYIRKNPQRKSTIKLIVTIIVVQLLVYVYCLGASYLANFSEHEACTLASYGRYMNIAYLAAWTALILGWLDVLISKIKLPWNMVLIGFILLFVLDLSTLKPLADFGFRRNVSKSLTMRAPHEWMKTIIHWQCDGDDRIYIVSQGDSGYHHWVTKFNARPNSVSSGHWGGRMDIGWSLGEPFFEEDNFTLPIAADDLRTVLLNQYDYLAIFNVDQTFIDNYGCLFSNPSHIAEQSLFYINKDSGLLERCQ